MISLRHLWPSTLAGQPDAALEFARQGLELGFSERYFLRTGYDYMPGQNERWLATRISVGGGLRLDAAAIDYSFTPNDKSTTEDIHRFTVSYSFGY